MHFLFPSDPIESKRVDAEFRDQADALRKAGLSVSVVNLDGIGAGNSTSQGLIPKNTAIIYRGWMLNPSEYQKLLEIINSHGATALIPSEMYLACHYLPNWYPLITDLTPETRIFPVDAELVSELKALGWKKFFIKDYVKSLKTSVGSTISKPEDILVVLSEMQKFRGTIEGGVCVRRFEDFISESEKRYFVIKGKPYAASGDVPEVVHECARRIKSHFFSVDVALRTDGVLRVVEVGDGQVSDLVGWKPESFAQLWRAESLTL